MLIGEWVQKYLLTKVAQTIICLINYSSMKINLKQISKERLFILKFNVSWFYIFNYLLHIYIRINKRNKLESISKLEIYLGLHKEIKDFRIYKLLDYKIEIIKDVILNESKFYKFNSTQTIFVIATIFLFF